MKPESESKIERAVPLRRTVLVSVAAVLLVSSSILGFLHFFAHYNDDILYAERLNQMQEVTEQLFAGLEDFTEGQWEMALTQRNFLENSGLQTVEELLAYMKHQAQMLQTEQHRIYMLAVDTSGRYYTRDGKQGLLVQMKDLKGEPERFSFVLNETMTSTTRMVFLYRLKTPLTLQDGSRTTTITYYGLSRDMNELNPYFDCKAYNGSNSTYVVDQQGLRLFSGSGSDPLKGYSIFSILQKMEYLHDSSFDEALAQLRAEGLAYSNAVLDGQEYYYAMYQMKNAAWTLLFLVPSSCVAANTVQLVSTTTRMFLLFAVGMILLCAALIYHLMTIQKLIELRTVEQNNAALAAANEELAQSNTALKQAQTATKEALQAAEMASKAKTDFLANMSHDIRTPMNAIIGITTLMKNEPDLSEKMQEYISKLDYSGVHLLELVNNVLDMSRIESGKTTLHIESIDLADQVMQVETIIRAQAEQKQQRFTLVTTHLNHEYVMADAARLQQLLINILSNAVKYTAPGGRILFELEELPRNDRYAKFKFIVQDNGMGMSEDFLKHLFDPFSRVENSVTNQIQGTGLGMAITKSIVDLMGGIISVKSTLGKGSRFEVTLEFPIDAAAEKNLPHLSLLLVRCHPGSESRIRDAVQGKNIQVHSLPTVAAALDNLSVASYDVVLTPLSLPAVELHPLRQAVGDAAILLGSAENPGQELTLREDLDGVLPYPFFLSSLESEVTRVQENRKAETAPESCSPLRGMKFLCAEDNALNAEILEMLLETKGASCTIYRNGQEIVDAFASVKPGDYDMILMDVQMPVMNGLDATRAIRSGSNPLGRTIPILAMTANAFLEDVQQSHNAGMDEHLSKPVDLTALEQAVRRFRSPPLK